jgi:hypothetical protein
VQMITIEDVSVEVKGSEVRTVLTALRSCSTCKGVEVGELVGEAGPEEANKAGENDCCGCWLARSSVLGG